MNIRDLIGVISPSTLSVAYPSGTDPAPATMIVPGAVAGLVGMSLVPKHRFLAFLGGEALGGNAFRLIRGQGDDHRRVLGALGITGSLIAGSLLWKKHPVLGGIGGFALGVLGTSFVRGTLSHRLIHGGRS